MSHLSSDDRKAILSRVDGGLVPNEVFDQLAAKGLVDRNKKDFTACGRMVAELLIELRRLSEERQR